MRHWRPQQLAYPPSPHPGYGQPQQVPFQYPQYPPPGAYPPYQMHPVGAVSLQRQRTSHGLHLFLSIITFGMWAIFVWLPITIWHKTGPRARTNTYYR